MIFDTIARLPQYLPPNVWNELEPFLSQLHPDIAEGKHWIREPEIFAGVSSYKTRPLKEGRFEAHRRYIDIQILLTGTETIAATPLGLPKSITEYDEQGDIQFYELFPPAVILTMQPGDFALFFPQDLHCPQLTPGEVPQEVKKVVIKIGVHLL